MFFRSSRDILLDHLTQVKEISALKGKADVANAALLEEELRKYGLRHKVLGRFRTVVAILLYASILSAFSVPVLNDVVQTILRIAGFVGVSVLSLAFLFLSFRMRELWNKMTIIYSHLIAIYEKNNKNLYDLAHLPA